MATKATRPQTNQPYYTFPTKFSSENFTKLDVVDILCSIGYSKAEARRLLLSGGVKIWDTRLDDGGKTFSWYKRVASQRELVEPEDVFVIGGKKFITIKKLNPPLPKRVFYWLRPYFERYILDKLSYGN